jgi:hypothetical protein
VIAEDKQRGAARVVAFETCFPAHVHYNGVGAL